MTYFGWPPVGLNIRKRMLAYAATSRLCGVLSLRSSRSAIQTLQSKNPDTGLGFLLCKESDDDLLSHG